MESDCDEMRKKMKENFIKLVEVYNSLKKEGNNNEIQPPPIFFLTFFLKNMLYKINLEKYREKCNHFFDFICLLLTSLSLDELNYIKQNPNTYFNLQELFTFSLNEFIKSSICEKNQKEKDYVLQGLLKLFETLNTIEPKFKEFLETNSKFLNYLFYGGLFEMPTGTYYFKKIIYFQFKLNNIKNIQNFYNFLFRFRVAYNNFTS